MALPSVSVPATLTVTEGSKLTIPVTKTGPGACQVQLVTAGNTANSPSDYIGYAPAWTVSFSSTQTTAQAFLTTVKDAVKEPAETVTLYVKNPVGCTVSQGKCVVTIVDASVPAPLPVVSLPLTLTVFEGNILQIPISKSGPGACTVKIKTTGKTATTVVDYAGFDPTSISFTAGETVKYMPLKTLTDKLAEGPESLTLTLQEPSGCTIGQSTCSVTIENVNLPAPPPPLPAVSLPTTLTVVEGNTLQIPVRKSGAGAASVKIKTTGKTAKTLEDYVGYDPTIISFTSTDTVKNATLKTLPDTLLEGAETLTLTIQEPVGCTIGQASCVVTIEDSTLKPVDPIPTPEPDPPTPPAEPDPPAAPDPTPEPPPVQPPVVEPVEPPQEPLPSPLPSKFARAIGFATAMEPWRWKTVYRVTNLNDSGPGSLRDAINRANCLVVFDVAGCIRLKSHLVMGYDNVTIAGQTAPFPGITVQGKEIQAKASNLRVQHIAFERGYDPTNLGNADVAKVSPGSDVSTWRRSFIHFDHCSFLWGLDETIEIWPAAGYLTNISFTECIFGEPLYRPQALGFAPHEKVAAGKQGEHNYGVLIGFNTKKVDIQNCLFHDMYMRCPFIDHGTSVVISNIILMNVRQGATIQQNQSPKPSAACVVNAQGILMISGPNQAADATGFRFHSYPAVWPDGSAVCVGPLYGWKASNSGITPGTKITFSGVQPTQGTPAKPVLTGTPPIQPPGTTVKALSADGIYERILLNAGPMPKAPQRSPSVARVVAKLKNKKPGWVDHESQVGGFSQYAQVNRKLEDAKLPDGSKIPLPVWSDANSVGKWLDIFSSLVGYD